MSFFTLAVITGLCLVFTPFRGYGVALLLYLYPLMSIGILLFAGIAYYLFKEKYR